jgi:hypothetical protein
MRGKSIERTATMAILLNIALAACVIDIPDSLFHGAPNGCLCNLRKADSVNVAVLEVLVSLEETAGVEIAGRPDGQKRLVTFIAENTCLAALSTRQQIA